MNEWRAMPKALGKRISALLPWKIMVQIMCQDAPEVAHESFKVPREFFKKDTMPCFFAKPWMVSCCSVVEV